MCFLYASFVLIIIVVKEQFVFPSLRNMRHAILFLILIISTHYSQCDPYICTCNSQFQLEYVTTNTVAVARVTHGESTGNVLALNVVLNAKS